VRAAVSSCKTFLLVVGCAKGGTAWLFDYLVQHPQAVTGYTKELHVLDAHFLPAFRDFHEARIAKKRLLIKIMRDADATVNETSIQQLSDEITGHRRSIYLSCNLNDYVEYFTSLSVKHETGRLVCDVTPSYCMLEAHHWAEVRELLQQAGFEVRVLFIMRDPIERAYSAYRMGQRQEDFRASLAPVTGRPRIRAKVRELGRKLSLSRVQRSPFLRAALEDTNVLRSRYDKTMAAVEAAFPKKNIHYAFFETFFNDESLRKFTDFVGLDFMPGAYSVKKNSSARNREMTDFEIEVLRSTFDESYKDCAERFGGEFIGRIWQHF
jgi:hypothetical protein